MKLFGIIFATFILSQAQAATPHWVRLKCSNSDGSVKWQAGYEEDSVELKYSNFVEGTLNLELSQVNVAFLKNTVIKEKSFKSCKSSVRAQVFTSEVKITASDKHPYILKSHFPDNRVHADVICSKITTIERACD